MMVAAETPGGTHSVTVHRWAFVLAFARSYGYQPKLSYHVSRHSAGLRRPKSD